MSEIKMTFAVFTNARKDSGEQIRVSTAMQFTGVDMADIMRQAKKIRDQGFTLGACIPGHYLRIP